MSFVLAIDLGTGSCRAVVFDSEGRQVAVGQREWTHFAVAGHPGSQVFDTEANWDLICASIADAIAGTGRPAAEIVAVSCSSMREGMVLFDAAGREIWACPNVDSRASREAAELVESGAARRFYERGGDWVAITSPARFLWIRKHEPEVFDAIASIGMLSDWVIKRLTGRLVTDPSSGSSSNLFDLRMRRWSADSLTEAGLSLDVAPEVVEPGTVVGEVMAAAAGATGLVAGTTVVAGGADTQLALLGLGVVDPGRLTLVGGTFWQLTVVTDKPLIDAQCRVRTLCHAVPDRWMTEGIGFYCGMAMRWFRDAFCQHEKDEASLAGIDPYVVLEAMAAEVAAGSNGLLATFANVMDAKRWVQAAPSFIGFDLTDPGRTGRAACVRAIEEQAAYVTRGHLEIITELTGTRYSEVTFTGGGAKGHLWPQIVADVLGLTVRVPDNKESTALGAALLAGRAVGLYDNGTGAAQRATNERVLEPRSPVRAVYDDGYRRWRETYADVLSLTERGLAQPMWWPAGADAVAGVRP